MHLRHVLAGHRLNDKPPVVGGEEAGPAAALAVAVHRGASCHRVLRETEEKREEEEKKIQPRDVMLRSRGRVPAQLPSTHTNQL